MDALLANRRVSLDRAPARGRSADPIEVLFVGHAPGVVHPEQLGTHGRSSLRRFGVDVDGLSVLSAARVRATTSAPATFPTLLDELRLQGALDADTQAELLGSDIATARKRLVAWLDEEVRAALLDVPLAFHTFSEFEAVFPVAAATPVRDVAYASDVVGPYAWLPRAVEDYFDGGGERLWVVVLAEEGRAASFLPAETPAGLVDSAELTGVEHVLRLDDVGLVACPDLERLLVPRSTPDVPEFAPSPAVPRFLPLRSMPRRAVEMTADVPLERVDDTSWTAVLGRIARFFARRRPDVQALLTLPLGKTLVDGQPTHDPDALSAFDRLRTLDESDRLRRAVQVVFPYLRDVRTRLASPVGRIAAAIHRTARTEGVWRSIASRPLGGDAVAFPRLEIDGAARLRTRHDVGVLQSDRAVLTLDDERSASRTFGQSAEAVRFWGFLRRQLTQLGEVALFDVDPRDPRPQLAIEQFLSELHSVGALDGRMPEDAFTVRQHDDGESRVVYVIELRLAVPIDHVRLSLVHSQGAWRLEDR